jgi:LacI family transcriptional regulator
MNSRVTVADVARHLELSAATVGHVINGRGDELRISAVTQARVHEAVREMGYRPNLSARSVRTGRFGCAALIQPLRGIYLPPGLLLGISQELHRHDMHLAVSDAPQELLGKAEFLPKVMRDLAADGLLVNVINEVPSKFEESLHRLSTPAVWINTDRTFDCVHPDDLGAAQRITKHLLKQGHRDIVYARSALFEGRITHYSEHDRYEGYQKAMHTARLKPVVWDIPAEPSTREAITHDGRTETALQLLSDVPRPSAIIAYEVASAMPFYHAALRLGLRVPGDLSLAAFHGGLNTQIALPLTTMHLQMWEVGNEAVRMLMQKIEQPDTPVPARAVPVDFFEGGTCAPPLS